MEIDPSDQNIEPLINLFEWKGIISNVTISQLITDAVLNKWIQTLIDWFNIVNIEE